MDTNLLTRFESRSSRLIETYQYNDLESWVVVHGSSVFRGKRLYASVLIYHCFLALLTVFFSLAWQERVSNCSWLGHLMLMRKNLCCKRIPRGQKEKPTTRQSTYSCFTDFHALHMQCKIPKTRDNRTRISFLNFNWAAEMRYIREAEVWNLWNARTGAGLISVHKSQICSVNIHSQ